MAISDIYLVQYLLQGTEAVPKRIVWRERPAEEYVADVNGVHLRLGRAYSSTGTRVSLLLTFKLDRVSIEEPRRGRLLQPRHERENDQELATLMKHLEAAVVRQCSLRGSAADEEKREIRETIFRRVLFEEPAVARTGARVGVGSRR